MRGYRERSVETPPTFIGRKASNTPRLVQASGQDVRLDGELVSPAVALHDDLYRSSAAEGRAENVRTHGSRRSAVEFHDLVPVADPGFFSRRSGHELHDAQAGSR